MRRVHINYDVLEKNGNDHLTYSDELQTINNEIKAIFNEINATWDSFSNNKEILFTEAKVFETNMQNDIDYVNKYGTTILKIKDNFKEKDTEYGKQFSNNVIEEEQEHAK